VALELIDDVEILNPLSVAINASNIRVLLALLPNLALQQAIVYGVLHLGLLHAISGVVRLVKVIVGESSGEANEATASSTVIACEWCGSIGRNSVY
jgi:hypothetical protein